MYIKDGTGMGYIYRNGEQDISNFFFLSRYNKHIKSNGL